MRYRTELMQQILTNTKAQEIIDYVSQIYGNSYVGLWLYQTIGSVLEPICDISDQLQQETSPATTELLISYYEDEYGIQPDPTMTLTQRRNAVVAAKRSKGACNPARLADAVSAALGGVEVEIIEYDGSNAGTTDIDGLGINTIDIDRFTIHGLTSDPAGDEKAITKDEIDSMVLMNQNIGTFTEGPLSTYDIESIVIYGQVPGGTINQNALRPNEFVVNIRESVKSTAPAVAVIERMKPAHLIYKIQGVSRETASTNVTIGAAVTLSEIYTVGVN